MNEGKNELEQKTEISGKRYRRKGTTAVSILLK